MPLRAQMSSRALSSGMEGRGLFSAGAQNPFSTWNQVFVPYCSSDVWTGDNARAVQGSTDGGEPYVLAFRGHRIVRAVFARLVASATSDDGTVVLPSFSSAGAVVLTGTSAGSVGAQVHADWLRSSLDAGVPFGAIFDAIIQFPYEVVGDGGLAPLNEALTRASFAFMHSDAGWSPRLDESCVAFHDAGTDAWRCFDLGHVVNHHVTSRFFARADLSDPNRINGNPIRVDAGTHALFQRQTLRFLRDAPGHSEEAAALLARPAVFGPNCGTHVVLTSSAALVGERVSDDAGQSWSMGQAVVTWLLDGGFGAAVDDLQTPTSVCP